MKKLFSVFLIGCTLSLMSCSENYSNGTRVGTITQFSKTGMWSKTHEGHLNTTQTGMNSSVPFDFSLDGDQESENQNLIKTLDSATLHGWKVELVYHQVKGYNWFGNRGDTNHFVTECKVLDRDFSNSFNNQRNTQSNVSGRVIDTIYVVVDKSELLRKK